MKPFATVLMVASLLVGWASATTRADELDELLSGDAGALQVEASPAAESQHMRVDVVPIEEREVDLTDHAHWQPVVTLVADEPTENAARQTTTRAVEAQSAFSAVPEPSAIALALLALGYFLVFGRRRFAA